MRRIALVGDIGSGKTFFSKLFKYPVFNADLVVSNLYKKDKFLFRKVKKKFPDKVSNFPLKKEDLLKIIFLVIGKTNKIPIISVANPGKINSKAAKAIAAPETIS